MRKKIFFITSPQSDKNGDFFIAKLNTKKLGHRLKGADFSELNKFMINQKGADYYYRSFGGWKFETDPVQILGNIEIELTETYRRPGRPKTGKKTTTNNGKKGGIIKGKSHTEGGVKAVVITDNNNPIELEDKEGILSKDTMESEQFYMFEGQMLNPKQIASILNIDHGGNSLMKKGGTIEKECKQSTKVQSILFDKNTFTKKQAINWLKKHNKKYNLDETDNNYRFRQEDPELFDKKTFKTIQFTNGIKAIIACPLDKMEKGGDVKIIESPETIEHKPTFEKIKKGAIKTAEDLGKSIEEDHKKVVKKLESKIKRLEKKLKEKEIKVIKPISNKKLVKKEQKTKPELKKIILKRKI